MQQFLLFPWWTMMHRGTGWWVKALEHYVWRLWLVYFHHFYFIDLGADDFWEGRLADLALEFCEIVWSGQAQVLFLHLVVYPLSQAVCVNVAAVTLAVARWYQGIFNCFFVAQTNLAVNIVFIHLVFISSDLAFEFSLHEYVKNLLPVSFLQISRVTIWFGVFSIEWLKHQVFDSPEFN